MSVIIVIKTIIYLKQNSWYVFKSNFDIVLEKRISKIALSMRKMYQSNASMKKNLLENYDYIDGEFFFIKLLQKRNSLSLSWRRPLSCGNQSIDLRSNALRYRCFSRNLAKIYKTAILTNFFRCLQSKNQWSIHPVVLFNPLMLVGTKWHPGSLSWSFAYVCMTFCYHQRVKGLKGVLEIFQG